MCVQPVTERVCALCGEELRIISVDPIQFEPCESNCGVIQRKRKKEDLVQDGIPMLLHLRCLIPADSKAAYRDIQDRSLLHRHCTETVCNQLDYYRTCSVCKEDLWVFNLSERQLVEGKKGRNCFLGKLLDEKWPEKELLPLLCSDCVDKPIYDAPMDEKKLKAESGQL